MFKLFEFILHGCWHEWSVNKRISLYGDGFGHDTSLPSGVMIEYYCNKCNRMKQREL